MKLLGKLWLKLHTLFTCAYCGQIIGSNRECQGCLEARGTRWLG